MKDISNISYLSQDPVLFKLALARHFLNTISKKVPQSTHDCLILEANIDSFLFFASSVIDVIKREINEKFEIFDKDNVFYIHGIRKQLADTGKQGLVKKIIASYFTTPTKNKSQKWNTKHSGLWKLQILRNKATHGYIIQPLSKKAIKITYTVRQYKRPGESFEFDDTVQDPRKYFEGFFSDLVSFVIKTRKVIQKNIG
ncbi:MAG TPA: hypothetical protein VNL34_00220 [Candidatus Nitrosotenuis sp.]|jgi:hypothetical protein|nr:hypothetical protein [Candidatus Nitrosotenuis sp.]